MNQENENQNPVVNENQNPVVLPEAEEINYRIKQPDAEDYAIACFITGQLYPMDFPRDPLAWLPQNRDMANFIYASVMSFGDNVRMTEDWFLANAPDNLVEQWERISCEAVFPKLDGKKLLNCFQRYDADNAARDLASLLYKWRKGKSISEICSQFNNWLAQAANDATIANSAEGTGSYAHLLDNLLETGVLSEPDTLDIPILSIQKGIRLRLGELAVLTARTSMGKSVFARQQALYTSIEEPVLYHSLENNPTELLRNFARAIRHEMDLRPYAGDRIAESKAIAERLKQHKLYVYHAEQNLQNMLATATMHARRDGVKLWVIDWLAFVKVASSSKRAATSHENITIICRALKSWAVKYHAAVLLVAQLSRLSEGQKPELHHLKESGSLEELSQLVLALHGNRESPDRQLRVLKNSSGQLCDINLRLDIPSLTFKI